MVWISLSLLYLAVVATGKTLTDSEENEDQEDVRRAIPGEPGLDYPTLATVPATSFSCADRREGFYADPESGCQVFHICALQRGAMGRQSFLCPNGTIFNAKVNTCDWWNKVYCDANPNPNPQVGDIAQVYPGAKTPQQQTLKLRDNDQTRFTSRRRKPSGSSLKPISETKIENFNALESRQKQQLLRHRGPTKMVHRESDQDYLVHYSRQPLSNLLSTEGYYQSTTQNIRKILGTKTYPTASTESSRISEVSIKPRVRYTHSLRASSDNPLYSLNPLIHVARDSSLLSTFPKSSDSSIKVTHPVERYVIDDVLPQYNYSKDVIPPKISPKTPMVIKTGDEDSEPIVFPDDLLFFPENANPLGGAEGTFREGFQSNGVIQGGATNGGNNRDDPVAQGGVTNGGYNRDGPVTQGGVTNGGYNRDSSVTQGGITNGGYNREGPVTQGGVINGGYNRDIPVTQGGINNGGYNREGPVTQGGVINGGYNRDIPVTQGGINNGGYNREGPVTQGGVSNRENNRDGPVTQGGVTNGVYNRDGPVTQGGVTNVGYNRDRPENQGGITNGGYNREGPVTQGGVSNRENNRDGPVTQGGVTNGVYNRDGPVTQGGVTNVGYNRDRPENQGGITNGGYNREGPVIQGGVTNRENNRDGPVTQGGVTNGGYQRDFPVVSTAKPDQSSNNKTDTKKNHYFLRVGSSVLSPSRDKTSKEKNPPLVRVSSGYSFTPTDVSNNNYFSTPKTLKVTNSYSVEENSPTEGPEINYKTNNIPHDSLGKAGDTETPSVFQNVEPFVNQGISSDGLSLSINSLQNIPSYYNVQSDRDGEFENNLNPPESSNNTNVEFINRFIVDEPDPQLPTSNSYNPNRFDTYTHSTPTYTPSFISNNYSPSSEPNLFSEISQGIKEGGITQPQFNFTFPPSSSSHEENNILNTTPKSNNVNGVLYNSIPGHYITKGPPEISTTRFNPNYSQHYRLNSGYMLRLRELSQPNQKSSSSLLTVQDARTNKESQRNVDSTTQRPEVVMTSPVNYEKSTFSQTSQGTTNLNEQYLSNGYLPSENTLGYNIPSSSYGSSTINQLVPQGQGAVSTEIPTQYSNFQKAYSPEIPPFIRYLPTQQNVPVPSNENILKSDKSVEIVDGKDKENILSGLKIDNVLPAVEAFSWSTVITPNTTEAPSTNLLTQINSMNYQELSTVSSHALLDNNDQNSFGRLTQERLKTSTGTRSWPGSDAPPPSPSNTYYSSDLVSLSNSPINYDQSKNNPSSSTDKTTATFINNNKEINLYTVSNIGTFSPSDEPYALIKNNDRPISSSDDYKSQRFENDFSTERNFQYNSFQQSTPFPRQFASTELASKSDKKYDPTKHFLSTEGIPSITSSTPKPFLESQGPYVAPQRHSTIVPDYKEEGKQLLNPADLLKINSLQGSKESTKDGNTESAELFKSISFSFDNPEDLEDFEIAKSKGWFS